MCVCGLEGSSRFLTTLAIACAASGSVWKSIDSEGLKALVPNNKRSNTHRGSCTGTLARLKRDCTWNQREGREGRREGRKGRNGACVSANAKEGKERNGKERVLTCAISHPRAQ